MSEQMKVFGGFSAIFNLLVDIKFNPFLCMPFCVRWQMTVLKAIKEWC